MSRADDENLGHQGEIEGPGARVERKVGFLGTELPSEAADLVYHRMGAVWRA
jgi:hypothetical protein